MLTRSSQSHPVQNPSKSKANNTRDATAPGSSQASWGRDSMAHGHGQPAARPTLPPPAPFKARMPDQVLQTNATASVLNQPHNAWDPVVYGTGPPALERGQPARGTALQPYQSDQPRSYNSIPGSSASSREQKSGSKAKDKDTKKSSEKEKKRHRETDPESSREEERQVPRKHPGDPYNRRQRQ